MEQQNNDRRTSVGNMNVDPDIYPKKELPALSTVNLVSESTKDISNKKHDGKMQDKIMAWVIGFARFLALLLLLYFFICCYSVKQTSPESV